MLTLAITNAGPISQELWCIHHHTIGRVAEFSLVIVCEDTYDTKAQQRELSPARMVLQLESHNDSLTSAEALHLAQLLARGTGEFDRLTAGTLISDG